MRSERSNHEDRVAFILGRLDDHREVSSRDPWSVEERREASQLARRDLNELARRRRANIEV